MAFKNRTRVKAVRRSAGKAKRSVIKNTAGARGKVRATGKTLAKQANKVPASTYNAIGSTLGGAAGSGYLKHQQNKRRLKAGGWKSRKTAAGKRQQRKAVKTSRSIVTGQAKAASKRARKSPTLRNKAISKMSNSPRMQKKLIKTTSSPRAMKSAAKRSGKTILRSKSPTKTRAKMKINNARVTRNMKKG